MFHSNQESSYFKWEVLSNGNVDFMSVSLCKKEKNCGKNNIKQLYLWKNKKIVDVLCSHRVYMR